MAVDDARDCGVELLGPPEIRSLASKLGVKPTKKLGQNFVIDPNTVRRIARVSGIGPKDLVVEVGPGLGSLTLALLEVGSRVIAVEIDERLAGELPHTIAWRAPDAVDRLSVVRADAMTVQPQALAGSEPDQGNAPTALVANLPYNVAVPILIHLLCTIPTIASATVMVQAEVARRLAAKPGNKNYGVPSVKASYFGSVELTGTIGKNVFWPAPNVDSALVTITRTFHAGRDDIDTRSATFRLVDAAFAQRRKMLRAALSGLCGGPDRAQHLCEAAGIDPTVRGERLGVEQFIDLASKALDLGVLTRTGYERAEK